jgi:hypothetical protein
MSDELLIPGFGFSGYRSVGSEPLRFPETKKINLIIGQNNAGKSNILCFLHQLYPSILSTIPDLRRGGGFGEVLPGLNDLDKPQGHPKGPLTLSFPVAPHTIEELVQAKPTFQPSHQNSHYSALQRLIWNEALVDVNGYLWFDFRLNAEGTGFERVIDAEKYLPLLEEDDWLWLYHGLIPVSRGHFDKNTVALTVKNLPLRELNVPGVELIPAIRRVGESGGDAQDYGGVGIIDRLAQIQNPRLEEHKKGKAQFDAINCFLRQVLETEDAAIEIPHDRQAILVHLNGRLLPLERLGTGIHEVIILATAATVLEDSVLCIEEPELHLHPALQRKFLKYLADNTSNQYFITTHSAHLLDAVPAEVFHISLGDDGQTKGYCSRTEAAKFDICHDLGYRASDILQANSVIWVEGPSDRIYLNWWIRALGPDLMEGVHYSIMFYGGRLARHLSGLDGDDRDELGENLISLRRLNRNSVIVMDSDKKGPDAEINETKQRLVEEFNQGPGFAWVTKGREIENYLDAAALWVVIRSVHSKAQEPDDKSEWARLLRWRPLDGGDEKTADKVKVAGAYSRDRRPDWEVLDLKDKCEKLINFVRSAN